MQSPSFSQIWTIADQAAMVELYAAAPAVGEKEAFEAWCEKTFIFDRKLEKALQSHVETLAKQGKITQEDLSGCLDTISCQLWNQVAQEKMNDQDWEHLFSKLIARPVQRLAAAKFKDGETIEQRYGAVLEAVEAGRFLPIHQDADDCAITGKRVRYAVDNWRLMPVDTQVLPADPQNPRAPRLKFIPLTRADLSLPGLQHLEIPCPSGQMLIADWLRIEAFTKITKEAYSKDENGYEKSINSVEGCAQRTRDLASLGVGFVFVGNSSPEVYPSAQGLVFGHTDPDIPAFSSPKSLGGVCTDLWWVVMVDKEVLESLLAKEVGGIEKSRQVVADYLKEQDVLQLSVPKGTLHLYSGGDPDMFKEKIAEWDFDNPGLAEPMFALSFSELPRRAPARRLSP